MAAVRIPLPDGKEALISPEDKHLACQTWRWSQGYVVCKKKEWNRETGEFRWVVCRLQREVLQAPKGAYIYFLDGDALNCQRSNLTQRYTNRPGRRTGRRCGDPANDGGWATRKRREIE